ncbi:hypothetical protein EGW08_000159 [Elysia chlorotica]|uniref:Uncharacterized protein n=1 Tax=Elysia chlorotica TaxID=188477 RepID=A0A433UE86_ELYCH|nr:hypothetical protein EGW08_000159 [Elysia chlorotica]
MAKDQLTVARAEVTGLSKSLEGCVRHTSDMTHELSMKQKENMASKRYTMEVLKCLEESRQENKACTNQQNTLLQETKGKEKDLAKINKLLSDKNMECELLSAKIFKIETLRQRQLELMKLTRINTTQMVREISGLRQSLVIERGQASKISCVVMRMQSQVEALQREYLSVLEKNALLVRSHEMSTSVIEQFEALKVVSDRRMGHLMKTNIDLYSQTTSQQEIALIQSHQFQLKENEIKGLLSRLEEEDHKVERMICKDKEKMNIIDHLHADMNNKEEKIKSLKSIIESYTQLNKSLSDKAEELTDQLRFAHTKSELVRRQRDLFGTRLLQAQAETQLCQTALHIAKETITDKSS